MQRRARIVSRVVLVVLFSLGALVAQHARSANVQFVGNVGYSSSGNTAVLTADRIQNFSTSGYSGTLRMELWALPNPFNGTAQTGYKLAQYALNQLTAGSYYSGVSSGTVAFGYPPNGTWAVAMLLTEYDNGPANGGYSTRDWVNFSQSLQVGPPTPSPGQIVVPSAYDFGARNVGAAGLAHTFALSNVGGTAVNLTGLTSSLPAEFAVSVGNCGYIPAASSCTFTVTFNPSVVGFRSAAITVYGAPNSPISFTVSGSGIAPAPPPGQLSVTGAVGYGNVTVGTTSGPSTVTVTNVGGAAVSISAISSSNPTEFPITGGNCAVVNAGASCAFTFVFSPSAAGARTGVISIYNNGTISPKTITVSGTGVAGSLPPATAITLIEYYHAAFDHYFITANPNEIEKLDNGTFAGWSRTGLQIQAYAIGAAGTSPTCRFFSAAFAPKSSHFYTPNSGECLTVQSNVNWQYEGQVFGVVLPDAGGNCPTGTVQLYRLYNSGQGQAPNHRYTTSLSVRATMIGKGWVPEGNGSQGVIACVPPTTTIPSGADGLWYGSTSALQTVYGIVLDTGPFYFLYTLPNTNTIAGVVQGNSAPAGGVFNATGVKDFNVVGYGVQNAVVNGSYVPHASLNGSFSSSISAATFATAFQSIYNQPVSMAGVSGTYSGSIASTAGPTTPAIVTIASSGSLVGNGGGCGFTGSVTPHGSVNVLDITVMFQGYPCAYPGATVVGAGFYDAGARRIYAFAMTSSRTDGAIFVGDKP